MTYRAILFVSFAKLIATCHIWPDSTSIEQFGAEVYYPWLFA